MDAGTYIDAAQSLANQPLGGKELRFPHTGESSVIPSSHYGTSFTAASVNVILRSPYNGDRCGGTRPGLKAFSGTQPTSAVSRWMWPNGEYILWPDGDKIAFSTLGATITSADGSVFINAHETFNVSASKGSIPSSCSAFAFYRARMIVTNGAMWYASRLGDRDDFDYGQDAEDATRPAAGNLALADRSGENITALAGIMDKALVMATKRSLWLCSGEITQSLSCVSDTIGIVSRDAWCYDGAVFWFWSANGLYAMSLGEAPVNMTPHLADKVCGWSSATMVYDVERNGIHIFGTDSSGAVSDWFYDIANKAMWRMSYPQSIRPAGGGFMMLDGKNRVVFVCADGAYRYWDENQITDDGTAIVSALAMGPVTHTTGNTENAFLAEMDFEFDTAVMSASGISVSGAVGNTSNAVVDKTKNLLAWVAGGASGSHSDESFRYSVASGWNKVVRPRVRCNSFAAMIWSTHGRWAISKITIAHRGCGRIRR